jgi:GTP cyclohydrolase I
MTNIIRPTKEQAMEAVKTLLAWSGDNPEREGLLDTPKRVVEAYEEYFSGYSQDAKAILSKTFEEVADYDDIVLLKGMRFESHCEHHIAPFIGTAHIAYIPNKKVVGISKIARLLDIFAKRLQTQETMTSQIADTLEAALRPVGVAILIEAEHQCMTTRGIHKPGTTTLTKKMTGAFKEDSKLESRFFKMINA